MPHKTYIGHMKGLDNLYRGLTMEDEINIVLDSIIKNGFLVTKSHQDTLDRIIGITVTTINFNEIIRWIEDSLEGVDFVSNKNAIYMNSNRIGGFGILKPVPNLRGYKLSISSDLLSVIQRTHHINSHTLIRIIKKWMWDCHGLKINTITKLNYNH